MKLIVESGATKTAWIALQEDGQVRRVQTSGLNPTCLDAEQCRSVVRDAVPALNPEGRRIEHIFFYGAGLVSEEAAYPVREALEMWCPFAHIEFHSDLLAAARALFGDGSGIVAIMGTGSNTCLYSSGSIVSNIRSGGFIIGDEGSGSAIGKALISDYVKGLFTPEVDALFRKSYELSYTDIVRKVYKEPGAAAFLASFAPFVMDNLDEPSGYLGNLLEENLDTFVRRTLCRYADAEGGPTLKVGVVGSFGCACRSVLQKIGERYGLQFDKFIKSPAEELVGYHGI